MAIIVDDLKIELRDVEVRTWHDTGLEFIPGDHERIRERVKGAVDTLVWHWTAAENDPTRVYDTLRRQGLGCEFAISRDGVVYQFCDPALVDARDCGSWWDRRSVGVEIVNYGMRRPASRPWSWHVPKKGRDRKVLETRLRGRKVFVASFYPAQVHAADVLALALRQTFEIPSVVPREPTGAVLDRPLSFTARRAWQGGEVGHLMITSRSKPDPGVPFLEHRAFVIGA